MLVVGMTWLQEIVWLIQNHSQMEEADKTRLNVRVPCVEMKENPRKTTSPITMLESRPHPWVIKSHLPAGVFQDHINAGQCKFIIVIRNIKDVLVSFYHFYRANVAFNFFKGSFADFFELFRNKRLFYGDWLNHSLGWWNQRHHSNVLFVTYESLKTSSANEIQRIARFCEKNLTSEKIQMIVNRTDFNSMKTNPMSHFTMGTPKKIYDSSISPLIRKGEVGDWKTYFTVEMNAFVEEHYIKRANEEGLLLKCTL